MSPTTTVYYWQSNYNAGAVCTWAELQQKARNLMPKAKLTDWPNRAIIAECPDGNELIVYNYEVCE